MPRSPITTHVLDVSKGRPAAGVPVVLEVQENGDWKELAKSQTDSDGRCSNLLPEDAIVNNGTYRLTFNTAAYSGEENGFYPYVPIIFEVRDASQHYHVPLLLSPFGYSTYRGS